MSTETRQAGANYMEIVLTPQMINAGADMVWEFRGFDPNFVAEKVFLAMMEHARKAEASSPERHSYL